MTSLRLRTLLALAFTVPIGGAEPPLPLVQLAPAQERALTAPSPSPVAATFRFDLPSGPQFTEAEKDTQRDAGKRVLPAVQDAFRAGAASVRIPPGDYRFGTERWDREGPVHALTFAGLQRTADQPFTIDATGATFWFDLPDDQAPTAHFAMGFKDCSHLILRGATLDRGTRGHVEGQITAFDFEGNRIEIQLSPGLSVPVSYSGKLEQRVVPFKADGTFCAPLYALQQGGVRLKYRGITPATQPGRYWVEMQETALLDRIRDPAWLRACGEQGVLRVGDGLSCIYAVSCAIELVRCAHLTLAGLRVYIPKGWGAEWGGEGAHLWKDCFFGPRPGTSQWQGGEGFMFCATRHGTTLDHVTIRHTTDDTANFHGYWGNIRSISGNRVTFDLNPHFGKHVWPGVRPGDRVLFHHKLRGDFLGEAKVATLAGDAAELDRAVDEFADSIAEFPDHACAGWTVQNCDWQDNYQRLLIQSGPGIVRNCRFTRQGSGIELNSVMPYVEGGVPRDITLEDNVFQEVKPMPQGAAVSVYAHTFGQGAAQLRNLIIRNNQFIRPGGPGIDLRGVNGGEITGNRFERPCEASAAGSPGKPGGRQAITLRNCSALRVEGNSLADPGNHTVPDPLTGSPLLGCHDSCTGIRLEGLPAFAALSTRALQEAIIPVRPGVPGRQPFWNSQAVQFLHAPSFEVPETDGAARYRFTLEPADGAPLQFEAPQPWAPLTPIWRTVPAGLAKLTVQGLDAQGQATGRPSTRSFHRAAVFAGDFPPPAMRWGDSARLALDSLVHSPDLHCWFTGDEPEDRFHLYRYPSKITGAAAAALALYATQNPPPADAADALQAAQRAADSLITLSFPADAAWACHPPTYHPTRFRDRLKGHMQPGRYLTLCGAETGLYYLDVFAATRDAKYLAAAVRIAETYAKRQLPAGSWLQFVEAQSGEPVTDNVLIPTRILAFLERLSQVTKDGKFKPVMDRALSWIASNPALTWNWQGQFEDVKPAAPYLNLTKHDACDFAMHLFQRAAEDPGKLALALDLLRFSEDQFVVWSCPPAQSPGQQNADGKAGARSRTWMLPCVLEQYRCYAPVCASSAKLIRTYLAAYRATGDVLHLEKARALAGTLTRAQSFPQAPGRYQTWLMKNPGAMWFNCELSAIRAVKELDEVEAKRARG